MSLSEMDLTGSNFSYSNHWNTNFASSNCVGVDFRHADLTRCIFKGADLRGANFAYAICHEADFSGADLRGANFSRAQMNYATLLGAKIKCANFAYVNLGRADMRLTCHADIRADFFSYRDFHELEKKAIRLRRALRWGRVDGAKFFCDPTDVGSARVIWLNAVRWGETPADSQFAAITAEWCDWVLRT